MNTGNNGYKALVIGGAKSGKTGFALSLAESILAHGKRGLYVATCQPMDDEMKAKVAAHQQERSPIWDTLEEHIAIEKATILTSRGRTHGVILVDCLTLWMLNIMEHFPNREKEQISRLVKWYRSVAENVIMVTNEVGLGIVPEGAFTRRYRELLGYLNQEIARVSQEVFFVMAGLHMKLKGGDHDHG